MNINDDTILKLENLSKLRIQDKESMKTKLSEVLTFMENLQNLPEEVEEVEDLETTFREDIISKTDLKDFFENNQKVVNNAFEVPKIL